MQVNGYIKKKPLVGIIVASCLFSFYVIGKYAYYSFATNVSQNVAANKTSNKSIPSDEIHRGSILDRNGKPLAVSANFYHFGVTPIAVKNKNPIVFAKTVAPILGESEKSILRILKDNEKSNFVYIKKKIDQSTYEELKRACDRGGYNTSVVRFDKVPGRVYPENDLAAQLIGFMGSDGNGLAGIEYSMDNVLSPSVDSVNKAKSNDIENYQGKNIYLTIDANLQSQLEKVANEAMNKTQASNLMLIAANAKNGEILSYISYPTFNLNEYSTATKEEKRNLPVTESYEPGSVFKIFSVASFLDEGVINPNEIFECDGVYERKTNSGEKIKITCLDHHGKITAREALKYSCNDALAQMSAKIESEIFINKLRSLGFGSKTGIELSGETTGSVRNTSDRYWSARSKPTIAIGQEIGVSALQMVEAATAIANGGIPVQLTLINKITNFKGEVEKNHSENPQPPKERVLKSSTAKYLLSCMETVAESGTGTKASLGDISIGVKTGTAQMADVKNGGYSSTDFLSNCIAVFPVENPEIILYIVIVKAKGETYAGRIVAPVINQAANIIIDHLGMSRGSAESLSHSGRISISKDSPIIIKDKLPDFRGMSKRQILPLFDRKDLHIKIVGDGGWVVEQKPAPDTKITGNMEIELIFK